MSFTAANDPNVQVLNIRTLKARREWARKVDDVLQRLKGAVQLSVTFPESDARNLLIAEQNWPNVKRDLATGSNKIGPLIKYRRRLTDALLAVEWLRVRQQYADQTDPFIETEPVGSVTLTSDLDVTTVGYSCALAVKHFNEDFRGSFCLEPGILLDSNVYCEIFKVHPAVPASIASLRDTPDQRPSFQDEMALTKLRRYMREEEWSQFKIAVVSGLPPPLQAAHQDRLKRAEDLYNEFLGGLYAKLPQLSGVTDSQPGQIASYVAECTRHEESEARGDGACAAERVCSANAVMKASNDLYATRLAQLRDELASATQPGVSQVAADVVKFDQGKANLFANESYNSQGPLLHILGVQQEKDPATKLQNLKSLTFEQVLNSVNEQFGDALKDLQHYSENGGTLGEAAFKSSKYIDRSLDGIRVMRDKAGARSPVVAMPATLMEAYFGVTYPLAELLKMRKGEGQYGAMNDTQRANAADPLIKAAGIGDLAGLREKLLQSATQFNVIARPASAPDPSTSPDL